MSADPSNTADLRDAYATAGRDRLDPIRSAVSRVSTFDDTTTIVDYLRQQTRNTLQNDEWYASFVRDAYARGIRDARDRLDSAGYAPSRQPAPQTALEGPAHFQDVSQLVGRSQQYWQKLERDLQAELTETVRDATRGDIAGAQIAQEDEDDVSDELDARIAAVGETRAALIAEYETAAAHERAVLREYRRSGITGTAIGVRAEAECVWDNRLCDDCIAIYENAPYTLQQAENLLPSHPRCRCSWVVSVGNNRY